MTTSTPTAVQTRVATSLFTRFRSVDILRGAVIVLMAIDHVRVYSGLPAGGPTAGIFFTRWITHFCAPAFVFFAGTSAFLYALKVQNTSKLARFLLTRGLLLAFLELTLIRLCWTFNLDFSAFILFGVIWMIGWCMVMMSALVWVRASLLGILGLAIIFLQQLFALVPNLFPSSVREPFSRFWNFIYPTATESWPGTSILYVLVPWIGVMMAGYGFGKILLMQSVKRRTLCLWIGLSAIIIFLIAGSVLIIRQTDEPGSLPFLFQLLNQRKYPASPLYLLMTLGPAIALVPFAEKAKGWLADILSTFGKVPMFYYLLHIPLIHITAVVVNEVRGAAGYYNWYASAPYASVPDEWKWSLGLLYLIFLIDVILLYFACKWYVKYKLGHPRQKWMTYI